MYLGTSAEAHPDSSKPPDEMHLSPIPRHFSSNRCARPKLMDEPNRQCHLIDNNGTNETTFASRDGHAFTTFWNMVGCTGNEIWQLSFLNRLNIRQAEEVSQRYPKCRLTLPPWSLCAKVAPAHEPMSSGLSLTLCPQCLYGQNEWMDEGLPIWKCARILNSSEAVCQRISPPGKVSYFAPENTALTVCGIGSRNARYLTDAR